MPARRCRLRRVRWRSDRNLDGAWRGVDARAALARSGDDVAVIPGTENYEPGNVRVSFLVADAQGQAVTLPTARVWVANALDARPFLETTAKLERIGVPGGAEADATHIYVANVKLPRAGKYWMLAEPEGGSTKVQALGNVVVVEGGRTSRRRRPRDCVEDADARIDGRRHLEADDSHAAGRVAPALFRCRLAAGEGAVRRDVRDAQVLREQDVRAGRRRRGGGAAHGSTTTRVRFIHVEVYEDNDPAKGYNRWMTGVEAPDRAMDVPRRTARGRSSIASRAPCRSTSWRPRFGRSWSRLSRCRRAARRRYSARAPSG